MRAAIRLQKDLGSDGYSLSPQLSREGNLPHVTVFQGPFAESLVPERELKRINASLVLPKEVRLSFTGIAHQPIGWLFLSFDRPPLLDTLQETALALLAPHLDRAELNASKDTGFSATERASFARYGYRYTGDAFAPHITLGRTEDHVARRLARSALQYTSVPQEWAFDRLSFYVIGENGAHSATLVDRSLAMRSP